MFRSLATLPVAVVLALAAPAFAQEKATGDNPAASQLDLGQPAEGPQLGQRYSKKKFEDWDLACIKTQAEKDPCSLLQVMKGPDGNPMAEFSLFRLEGGERAVAAATIVVPLETLLPAQLTIAVDDHPGKRYQYSFCSPIGCIAQIGLTEEDIAAMKKGKTATLSLVPAPAPDQVVKLTLSLKGFTAGYEAVDVVKNQ